MNNQKDTTTAHIVFVDDKLLDTRIFKILVKSLENVSLETFLDPEKALEHIRDKNYGEDQQKNILIVDLFLPHVSDGLIFLQLFNSFPSDIKDRYKVFVVDSTGDKDELDQVKQAISHYAFVEQEFIKKPLKKEGISMVFSAAA